MGNDISKDFFGSPQDIVAFRRLPRNTPGDTIKIPEIIKKRHFTDVGFSIAYVIIVTILIAFVTHLLEKSNIKRYNGYDICGNICGIKNYKYFQWSCTGQDFTNKPLLEIDATVMSLSTKKSRYYSVNRKCVAECDSGYERISSTCYLRETETYLLSNRSKQKFDDEVFSMKSFYQYLNKNMWRILLACFCSVGLIILLFTFMVWKPDYLICTIIAGILLFGALLIALLLCAIFKIEGKIELNDILLMVFGGLIVLLIVIFNLIVLYLICVMRSTMKKIKLFIQLLKETIRAATATPSLICVPIIMSLLQLIMLGILIWTSIEITSSNMIKEGNHINYGYTLFSVFTVILHIFVYVWTSEISRAFELSLIAGAGATWYWSKTKKNLGNPVCKFTFIILCFHFGSIAFGSLLLVIIRVLKLFWSRKKEENGTDAGNPIYNFIEIITQIVNSITYVVIVLHGTPFFKSGKRAYQLVGINILKISAIISIGSMIGILLYYFMFIFSILITLGIMQETDTKWFWLPYLIVLVLTYHIAIIVSTTYESLFLTILICYCEDSIINEGNGKAATPELQDFIEKATELYQ